MDNEQEGIFLPLTEPLEAIYDMWSRMYPVAYGPWEDTGLPCNNGPECECGGKGERQVRTVLMSHVN